MLACAPASVSWADRASIAAAVATTTASLAASGGAHGRLTPANVGLVARGGAGFAPVLIDTGLAALTTDPAAASLADAPALGALLLALVTGRPDAAAAAAAVADGAAAADPALPPPPPSLVQGLAAVGGALASGSLTLADAASALAAVAAGDGAVVAARVAGVVDPPLEAALATEVARRVASGEMVGAAAADDDKGMADLDDLPTPPPVPKERERETAAV